MTMAVVVYESISTQKNETLYTITNDAARSDECVTQWECHVMHTLTLV
jgi:hypothetical protein